MKRNARIVSLFVALAAVASIAAAQAYTQYYDYYQTLKVDTLDIGGTSGNVVVNNGASTDNAIARFDSTTGQIVQNSAVTVADTTGTITTPGQFVSTVATGTAPLTVASTTNVANLNASSLGGATFAAPGAIGGGTPGAGTFTTLVAGTSAKVGANGSVYALIQQFTGTVPNAGTSVAISATGVTATDLAVGAIVEDPTNDVAISSIVCSTDTVTVTLTGDPGASNADVVVIVTRI